MRSQTLRADGSGDDSDQQRDDREHARSSERIDCPRSSTAGAHIRHRPPGRQFRFTGDTACLLDLCALRGDTARPQVERIEGRGNGHVISRFSELRSVQEKCQMKLSNPSVPSSRCATKGSSAASEKLSRRACAVVRTSAPRAATIRAARSASGSSASSTSARTSGAMPRRSRSSAIRKIAGSPLGELGGAGRPRSARHSPGCAAEHRSVLVAVCRSDTPLREPLLELGGRVIAATECA